MLTPETGEVLGDLDGTHVGREDVEKDRDAGHCDFRCGVNVVELLDAEGDVRGIAQLV